MATVGAVVSPLTPPTADLPSPATYCTFVADPHISKLRQSKIVAWQRESSMTNIYRYFQLNAHSCLTSIISRVAKERVGAADVHVGSFDVHGT